MPIFLDQLPCFDRFDETTQFDQYVPVPPSWFVFIADIKGSTKAAEEGRYKEVNLVGASCIISVLNAVGEDAALYVFGGDGATFVVGPECEKEVQVALVGTAQLAAREFGLELRVARIPVAELKARGYRLAAARWRLGPRQTQPLLSGSGVTAADAIAKSEPAFLVSESSGDANFAGLECRWNPIPSEQGQILSLLVDCPLEDARAQEVYEKVVAQVDQIYGTNANPSKHSQMTIAWNPKRFLGEAKVRSSRWFRFIYLLVHYVLTHFWDITRWPMANKYREEVVAHSDYRKFDGTLRMVVDGTVAQHDSLEKWLDQKRNEGILEWGTHRSESALLTCLIFERWTGRHLHLVDGNDGGYSLAAKAMKARKLANNAKKQESN